jgi:hypothetical protein
LFQVALRLAKASSRIAIADALPSAWGEENTRCVCTGRGFGSNIVRYEA